LAPFQRPAYQNAVLKKVYPHTGLLTPIEYIQLEQRGDALTAFVYLIQFAYEHNENIIAKLQRPRLVATQSHLRLAHSSAEQLYLLPKHGVPSSILQLLNTCDTAMGRRFFRDCLVHPLCNAARIDERYRRSDAVRPHITPLRACLKGIKDLERLFRRIALRLAQPPEIAVLVGSLQCVDQLIGMINGHGLDLGLDVPSLQAIIDHCTRRWDMSKLDTNADHFYQRGVYPEMDALADTVEAHRGMFQKVVDDANRVVGDTFFKLETTAERHDYQIIITKKRYETYTEKTKGQTLPPVFTVQPVSASNKTVLKATFPKMDAIQHALHRHTGDLRAMVHDQYLLDLDGLHVFADAMQTAVTFVSAIDFHVTCAKNAQTFRYCRPTVEATASSFLRGTGLRHPLIEVVQTDLPYIANDIALGGVGDNGDNPSGILLYGINAAGKSSYMKSVGLALIMAQSGMYVAADTFAFSPYDHIFTRIPGGDNLFKGQSTFVAEISELRTILNEGTHRSLVIGDELASGTESVSAISIVAAGVKTLADRRASFIFATHLHEVAELAVIQGLANVAIFHISVHYDDARGVLVYDRLLKPGCGETLYGLEVCKSLDMPLAFMQLAHTIRKEHLHLSPTVVDTKVSRYSSEVFVDVCSVCHQRAEEVHHIQHQAGADKDGFIGRMHKNDTHNLVALCQTCHDKVHNNTVKMDGVAQTSAGKMVITHVIDDTAMLKKQIDVKDAVQSLRKQGKSYKAIAEELKLTVYEVRKKMLVD
jgi:DNA mismatch repair protein MutS